MKKEVKYLKASYIIVYDDNTHKILKDGYIAYEGDKIVDFGHVLPQGAIAEDLGNSIICPGFVDLHVHSYTPLEKSVTEDTGNPMMFQSCLLDLIMTFKYSPDIAEKLAKFTLADLLVNGVTTFLEMGTEVSPFTTKCAGEMGMRAYVGASYRSAVWDTTNGRTLDFPYDDKWGTKMMEKAIDELMPYHHSYNDRIRMILSPTETISCTSEMLRQTRKIADELKCGVTIHVAELVAEIHECMRRYGRTPIQQLEYNGMLAPDVILGHAIMPSGHSAAYYIGANDLDLLAASGASVAHCPWIFARRGIAMESFKKYKDMGINMGIGTDTFPHDFTKELRCAASVSKIIEHDNFATTAKDVFDAATIGGAAAFHRDDIGRLGKGCKADMVVFSIDNLEMSPIRDPIKNIVYSATRNSINRVYVDGKLLVDKGEILGLDVDKIISDIQIVSQEIWETTSERDWSGRSIEDFSPMPYPIYR